jgi:hypothetical protein
VHAHDIARLLTERDLLLDGGVRTTDPDREISLLGSAQSHSCERETNIVSSLQSQKDKRATNPVPELPTVQASLILVVSKRPDERDELTKLLHLVVVLSLGGRSGLPSEGNEARTSQQCEAEGAATEMGL